MDMLLRCDVVTLTTLMLLMVVVPNVMSVHLPRPSGKLGVYALPVGQGDCTIIQCPKPSGNIVVMDCGTSGGNRFSSKDVENFLGSQINKVVAIMITHPDRDHFNYLPQINWNRKGIGAVIIGGTPQNYYRSNNNEFKMIYNFLMDADKAGKLYTISNGQKCIGNCALQNIGTDFCGNKNIQFQILAANVRSRSNQKSIVMKIVVGKWSMLLSGDMEGAAATQIAKSLGSHLHSTVYKMSHHGASSQANRIKWLTPIKPKYAFASSGYNHGNNRHPRCDAVQRLLSLGTIVHAKGHSFYCGNRRGVGPTTYDNFKWHIYETSPRSNEVCILAYYSNEKFIQHCMRIPLV